MTKLSSEDWYRESVARKSIRVSKSHRVTGVRNEHCGGRWEFAEATVSIEPAGELAIEIPDVDPHGFAKAAAYGVIDEFLTGAASPLTAVKLIVGPIKSDPVDSSIVAFRHAGRDAGRKLLDEVQSVQFSKL